jgi:hypothetical protein
MMGPLAGGTFREMWISMVDESCGSSLTHRSKESKATLVIGVAVLHHQTAFNESKEPFNGRLGLCVR